MNQPRYSIDTSIFIENWQRLYPPDVFPSVWRFMESLIADGRGLVSHEVLEELKKKDDELLGWMSGRENLLVPTGDEIQIRTIEINDQFPNLTDVERERGVADPFVIAVAEVRSCSVVTYERPRTRTTRPPKIPDVCAARGQVDCIDFVELARREQFQL